MCEWLMNSDWMKPIAEEWMKNNYTPKEEEKEMGERGGPCEDLLIGYDAA